VQLGWGDVNLGQQLHLESGEGQTHPDTLKDNLVEIKERDPVIGPLIPINRLPYSAREHCNVIIMPLPESTMVVGTWFPYVVPLGFCGN